MIGPSLWNGLPQLPFPAPPVSQDFQTVPSLSRQKVRGQRPGAFNVQDQLLVFLSPDTMATEKEPHIVQDHLVVLVHGITATVRDWNYVRDQLSSRLGRNFLVYASSSNEALKTFQGVDRAGERLSQEVKDLVAQKPALKHISIMGHSLGGLIARYAIALLYNGDSNHSGSIASEGSIEGSSSTDSHQHTVCSSGAGASAVRRGNGGKIAGLDAACFITLATPHLGVRGKGQLPFLLGVDLFEWIAVPVAPLLVGRTGKQLFLSDGKPAAGKMPLLVRMATPPSWQGDPPFLAALGAFHTRVTYANAGFDHMVGWQTASLRRASELPQVPKQPISPLYKHVMLVQDCPASPLKNQLKAAPHTTSAEEMAGPSEGSEEMAIQQQSPLANDGEAESFASENASGSVAPATFHAMQEQMISGLQTLPWRKVDVSFRNGIFPFFAHNNIHVKLHWLHFDGAGVVRHLADTMQELETLYLQSRL